jgi:hypothetical protein
MSPRLAGPADGPDRAAADRARQAPPCAPTGCCQARGGRSPRRAASGRPRARCC